MYSLFYTNRAWRVLKNTAILVEVIGDTSREIVTD